MCSQSSGRDGLQDVAQVFPFKGSATSCTVQAEMELPTLNRSGMAPFGRKKVAAFFPSHPSWQCLLDLLNY